MTSHSIEGLSDGGLREKIARIIDPDAFKTKAEWPAELGRKMADQVFARLMADTTVERFSPRRAEALAKADAILALSAAPSDGWVLVPREPGTCELDDSGWLLTFVSALHPPGTAAPVSWSDFSDEQRERIKTAYRAMLSAAPERVEGGGWEPIESAPRDGTDVLVWWPIVAVDDEGNLTDRITGGARLISGWSGGYWSEPDLLNCLNSAAFDDEEEYAEGPALWQPLPSPPIGAGGGRPTSSDGSAA